MALIVAGERSGVGKTTVTLAILAYLCRVYAKTTPTTVQSFKVGPDYIDPMFHRYVTNRPCRNLDPILTSEDYVKRCFQHHASTADFTLIEGVMGLFDGASGDDDVGSTAHIARLLNVPVLLVLDCSRLSRSVAAIAHGFKTFDPAITLAGVVLNRVGSDRHLTMLRAALRPLDLPILGVIHRDTTLTLPDRHLGLIPTDELPHLDTTLTHLAHLAQTSLHWDTLLPLLTTTPTHPPTLPPPSSLFPPHPSSLLPSPKIAIAHDPAFNFYYADNLDALTHHGADLIEWSPLGDPVLPEGISGLYFGGGFPEMFAADLAHNQTMREAVRQAIAQGIPTIAECGGLMFLCEYLVDFDGTPWPMVGILPTTVRMGRTLTLGYRQAIAQHHTPLLAQGDAIWGHEFHHSTQDPPSKPHPYTPLYTAKPYAPHTPFTSEGWTHPSTHPPTHPLTPPPSSLHASYIHLHWGDRPDIPARFIAHCQTWKKRENMD